MDFDALRSRGPWPMPTRVAGVWFPRKIQRIKRWDLPIDTETAGLEDYLRHMYLGAIVICIVAATAVFLSGEHRVKTISLVFKVNHVVVFFLATLLDITVITVFAVLALNPNYQGLHPNMLYKIVVDAGLSIIALVFTSQKPGTHLVVASLAVHMASFPATNLVTQYHTFDGVDILSNVIIDATFGVSMTEKEPSHTALIVLGLEAKLLKYVGTLLKNEIARIRAANLAALQRQAAGGQAVEVRRAGGDEEVPGAVIG